MNLEAISAAIKVVSEAGKTLMEDDDLKKVVFGTYSDGSTRSLPDAWNGEFASPKEKKKAVDRSEKRKKKRKKQLKKAKKKLKKKYKL